ncbi:MAG: hypothetical protein H8D87_17805 [Deltaproteobacteria bacterium]|uniref:hypothetical protein n=1 Tax=Desulfobacula sp. TaxID=2593537 RepID=UPI0019C45116|nr:hypothetical protein [Candidatus Desulfobacula maris]MBL6995359.1 hypothetical protein [Desulfobacula sp.]
MDLNSYQMSFSGQVLERGFWLYVWKIKFENCLYFYVGRTGDSSSAHASSPFNRIGQHLDFRKNAKGNSLARRLKASAINPYKSKFDMLALGPFFCEQDTFEKHKPFRDHMATIEYEVANVLKENNFNVLGIHHPKAEVSKAEIENVTNRIIKFAKA